MASKQGKITLGVKKTTDDGNFRSCEKTCTRMSQIQIAKPMRGGISFGAMYQERQKMMKDDRRHPVAQDQVDASMLGTDELTSSPRSMAPSPEPTVSLQGVRPGTGRAVTRRRQRYDHISNHIGMRVQPANFLQQATPRQHPGYH